jgi:flagellar protein FlbD
VIKLTRINRVPLVLNSDLIEHIESTPDTVISLTNGQKFVVLETVEETIGKVLEFRRAVHACDRWNSMGRAAEDGK